MSSSNGKILVCFELVQWQPLEYKALFDILGARGREFALSSYCLSPDLYTRVMYARDYVNMMMEDCFLLRSHFLSPLLPSFHHD